MDLSGNVLVELDNFPCLPNLVMLKLTGNKLQRLNYSSKGKRKMTQLVRVDLSRNKELVSLEGLAEFAPNLRVINLASTGHVFCWRKAASSVYLHMYIAVCVCNELQVFLVQRSTLIA